MHRRAGGLLAAMVAAAGRVIPGHAAALAAAALAGTWVATAPGQVRSVYPDDSVAARDAIVRVTELHAANNTGEAVRVLQSVLDQDAERLLPRTDDSDVLRPVRDAVHELLRTDATLRERYIADQEPVAASLLAAGELVRIERTMLYTPSGFEAALRIAQEELEHARFESARMVLEQLEQHPLRTQQQARDAAAVATVLASYLRSVEPMAAEWTKTASMNAGVLPARQVPALAKVRGRGPLEAGPEPRGDAAGMNPLQSAGFEPESYEARAELAREMLDIRGGNDRGAWVFPTIEGGRVYATDGMRLCAWDASTLTPLWVCSPTGRSLTEMFATDAPLQMGLAGGNASVEDPSTVTVSQGIAVFAGGIAFNGGRAGDQRVHAVDATTGEVLWSTDISLLESRRLGGRETNSTVAVRGNLVIDGDTVVAAVRRAGQLRRITSLYLVGLDLHTGAVKWTRLVGGYGTNPWGRTTTRPEGMIADRGVVYRTDDMGVVAAFEAATGRPRWVRLLPTRASFDFSMRSEQEPAPFAMHVPLLRGDRLYLVEPELVNAPGRIIELDVKTGLLLHERDGSAMARPQYLIGAGDYLGAVSEGRIAFVKFDELAKGTVRLSDSYASPNVVGRATVTTDGAVLLPLADAIARIDPADPAASVRRPVSMSGNVLIADREEGGGEHLLVADDRGLHTYLDWKHAQVLLDKRIKASPKDPAPLLTYIDLAGRVGRAEMIAGLSDTALAVIDATVDTAAASAARSRLFGLLAETVAKSRREWAALGALEADETPDVFDRPPVRDLAVLDEIVERLMRSAESAAHTANAHFERAWLRTVQKRYPDAVESLQAILLDAALSEVMVPPQALGDGQSAAGMGLPSGAERAGDAAKTKLIALLGSQGPGIYAAFDEECTREAAAIAADGKAEEFERLARRYPAASAAAALWARAGERRIALGDAAGARSALGAGVAAAELSASIGRPDQAAVLGRLAGRLVGICTLKNDVEPVYRLLVRLARDYPAATFETPVSMAGVTGASTPLELSNALAQVLAQRADLARVGPRCEGSTQVLAAWEPLGPISRRLAGGSGAGLVMYHEGMGQVGYWATDALDGQLHLVWSRRYEARPTVVRTTAQATWLFWPTTAGGVLESVSNVGGRTQVGTTQWKTQDIGLLFPPLLAGEGSDRFNTPTDGQVRPDDMLVVCDADRIVVVQRRGGAACVDASSGKLLWSKMLEVTRVFEAELSGEHLLTAGTYLNKGEGRYLPLVVSQRLNDGEVGAKLTATQLGDHPRWLRSLPGGEVLVGAAAGMLKFDPSTGGVAWSIPGEPARSSLGAWVVGSAAMVLTNESQVWRLDLANGRFDAAASDTHGRVNFPMSARVNGTNLIITSAKGLAILNEAGELVGTDGLDGVPAVEPPEAGASVVYAIESDPFSTEEEAPMLRIFCFEQPGARLVGVQRLRVGDRPAGITLIDGKLIIPCGALTLVVDAPAP